MTSMESVIRPFQSRDVTPPRRSPTSGGSSAGPLQITVGGVAAAGYQIAVAVSQETLPGGAVTVSYTLSGSDNLQSAQVGIVNAINANANLIALGVVASGVSGSPMRFTITQPITLKPQATISASSTGGIVLNLNSGVVQISVPRSSAIKTMTGNYSSTITRYTKKWPKEMTLAEALTRNEPLVP